MRNYHKKVDLEEWAPAFERTLKDWSWDIAADVKDAVTRAGKYALEELRDNMGEQNVGKPNGRYRKSWRVVGILEKAHAKQIAVCSTEYRIAHLLEKGHIVRNQTGKVYGKTHPLPHIGPAERAATEFLEREVAKIIKGSAR